jgi:uncharacterized CHY-type Zn-finger protein
MADLWASDSLRGMYEFSKQEMDRNSITKDEGVGFFKRLGLINKRVKEHHEKKKQINKILDNIICPHCLKSVIINQINFSCPYCNEVYNTNLNIEIDQAFKKNKETNPMPDILGVEKFIKEVYHIDLKPIIYDQCNKCAGKIKYIECPHCLKPIDLMAPYNYEELEAKRYE